MSVLHALHVLHRAHSSYHLYKRAYDRAQANRAARGEEPVALAATQFALQPATQDGETALFLDMRMGFSHALPGWPRAAHVTGGPEEPATDAMIEFWDFPMWLRYRAERMTGRAASAMHAAVDWATAYARSRARREVSASPATADRVAAWHVEAAAVASYALPRADARGATHEDLTVLVRDWQILAVTRRHPGAADDWPRYAAFRAAVDATMRWDPMSYRYEPRIWPPSSFLEPMPLPVLVPARQQALGSLAAALRVPAAEREAIGAVLRTFIETNVPPWHAVTAADRDRWRQSLARGVATQPARDVVSRMLEEVHTAHDLRGLAVFVGTALAG